MKNSKDLVYKILIPAEEKDADFLPQETLVCGRPVASTDFGGICQSMEHQINVLVYSTKEPQTLANKIQPMLEGTDLLLRFISANLEQTQGFTWEKDVAGFEQTIFK